MSDIHSPLRYAGGKYYARKLILNLLPAHTAYLEPFAGGASIFFAKSKAKVNHLNDKDGDVMRVFRVIRDTPDALIAFLADLPRPTRDSHAFYKNSFVPNTEIEQAGRWYYLNRISFSGIMKMQNCFWGYGDRNSMPPQHWSRVIRSTSEKLQGVFLTHDDFEIVIDAAEDGTLLFIDPPYFNADQSKFYPVSFNREAHERLVNVLHRNADRLAFLLTYDDCEAIRQMYGWANRIESNEWNYCISGPRPKGKEVFIRNYELPSERYLRFS